MMLLVMSVWLGLWEARKAMHDYTCCTTHRIDQFYWCPFLSWSQIHRSESSRMRYVLRACVQKRWQKLQIWQRENWLLSLKTHLSFSLHEEKASESLFFQAPNWNLSFIIMCYFRHQMLCHSILPAYFGIFNYISNISSDHNNISLSKFF